MKNFQPHSKVASINPRDHHLSADAADPRTQEQQLLSNHVRKQSQPTHQKNMMSQLMSQTAINDQQLDYDASEPNFENTQIVAPIQAVRVPRRQSAVGSSSAYPSAQNSDLEITNADYNNMQLGELGLAGQHKAVLQTASSPNIFSMTQHQEIMRSGQGFMDANMQTPIQARRGSIGREALPQLARSQQISRTTHLAYSRPQSTQQKIKRVSKVRGQPGRASAMGRPQGIMTSFGMSMAAQMLIDPQNAQSFARAREAERLQQQSALTVKRNSAANIMQQRRRVQTSAFRSGSRRSALSSACTTKNQAAPNYAERASTQLLPGQSAMQPGNELNSVSSLLLQNLKLQMQKEEQLRIEEERYAQQLNKIRAIVDSDSNAASHQKVKRISKLKKIQQSMVEDGPRQHTAEEDQHTLEQYGNLSQYAGRRGTRLKARSPKQLKKQYSEQLAVRRGQANSSLRQANSSVALHAQRPQTSTTQNPENRHAARLGRLWVQDGVLYGEDERGEARMVRSGSPATRSGSFKRRVSRSPSSPKRKKSRSPSAKKSTKRTKSKKKLSRKSSGSPSPDGQHDSPEFGVNVRIDRQLSKVDKSAGPESAMRTRSSKKHRPTQVKIVQPPMDLGNLGSRKYYEVIRPSGEQTEAERQKWRQERAEAIRAQAAEMHQQADEWADNLLRCIDSELELVQADQARERSRSAKPREQRVSADAAAVRHARPGEENYVESAQTLSHIQRNAAGYGQPQTEHASSIGQRHYGDVIIRQQSQKSSSKRVSIQPSVGKLDTGVRFEDEQYDEEKDFNLPDPMAVMQEHYERQQVSMQIHQQDMLRQQQMAQQQQDQVPPELQMGKGLTAPAIIVDQQNDQLLPPVQLNLAKEHIQTKQSIESKKSSQGGSPKQKSTRSKQKKERPKAPIASQRRKTENLSSKRMSGMPRNSSNNLLQPNSGKQRTTENLMISRESSPSSRGSPNRVVQSGEGFASRASRHSRKASSKSASKGRLVEDYTGTGEIEDDEQEDSFADTDQVKRDVRSSSQQSELQVFSEKEPKLGPMSALGSQYPRKCMIYTSSDEEHDEPTKKKLQALDIVKLRKTDNYSRSVFHDLPENFLLECINAADQVRRDVSFTFKKRKPIVAPELFETLPQITDLIVQEREAYRQTTWEENKKAKDQVQLDFKTIKALGKRDDLRAPIGLTRPDYQHGQYELAYNQSNKLNLVWHENFKENTRQWLMAYDPYKSLKMLQIYGKDPPKSFQTRLRKLEEMKNLLDRYSQISPVVGATVLDELKRNWNGSRRDYLAQKDAQNYDKINADLAAIRSHFDPGQPLYLKKLDLDCSVQIEQQVLLEARERFMQGISTDQLLYEKLNDKFYTIGQTLEDLELETTTKKYNLQELIVNCDFNRAVEKSTNDLQPDPIDMKVLFRLFFGDYMMLNISQIDQGLLEDSSDMKHDNPSYVHDQLRYLIYQSGELCHDHRRQLYYQGFADSMQAKAFAKKLELNAAPSFICKNQGGPSRVYNTELPDALAQIGQHNPVNSDFILKPFRLKIDQLFEFMHKIAKSFNSQFSDAKQEEDFDLEFYEAANRNLKKKKKKAGGNVVDDIMHLDLPLHINYEDKQIVDTVQHIMMIHSDRPQHKNAPRWARVRKVEKLSAEYCSYIMHLTDSDTDVSESEGLDLDALLEGRAKKKKAQDRANQLMQLVGEGSIIPAEVAFLDFIVDEEVEKFWLKPAQSLEEIRLKRKDGALSLQGTGRSSSPKAGSSPKNTLSPQSKQSISPLKLQPADGTANISIVDQEDPSVSPNSRHTKQFFGNNENMLSLGLEKTVLHDLQNMRAIRRRVRYWPGFTTFSGACLGEIEEDSIGQQSETDESVVYKAASQSNTEEVKHSQQIYKEEILNIDEEQKEHDEHERVDLRKKITSSDDLSKQISVQQMDSDSASPLVIQNKKENENPQQLDDQEFQFDKQVMATEQIQSDEEQEQMYSQVRADELFFNYRLGQLMLNQF